MLDSPAASTAPAPLPGSTLNHKAIGIAAGGGYVYLSGQDAANRIQGIADMGARWFRFDIDWSRIQVRGADAYDWAPYDSVAREAKSRGLHVLGIIDRTPPWDRLVKCKDDDVCYPSDLAAFGTFAATAAEHFAGVIDAFEIGNEPNISPFAKPAPDAAAYAEMLKVAYQAIKSSKNPLWVVAGGTTNVAPQGGGGNIWHQGWLTDLYAAWSGKSYFDAYSFHPYPFDNPSDPPQQGFGEVTALHDIMEQHGDGAKAIWLTEFGYSTGGVDHTQFVDDTAQAANYAYAAQWYQTAPNWVGPLLFYSFQDETTDGADPNDSQSHYGLVDRNGRHKQAYDVVRQAAHQFAG